MKYPTIANTSNLTLPALLLLLVVWVGHASAQEANFPEPGANTEPVMVVNINTDDPEKMAELLAGVGPARAEAIVEYREMHGDFATVDDLTNVSGIGPATLEAIRDQLIVQAAE